MGMWSKATLWILSLEQERERACSKGQSLSYSIVIVLLFGFVNDYNWPVRNLLPAKQLVLWQVKIRPQY